MFTGSVPFSNDPFVTVILAVVQGKRPPRPIHPTFTEDLWTLVQRCWDQDPSLRPKISEVALQLLTLSVCNRLVGCTPTTREHVSLIATIFLDSGQVKMVEDVSGDDAQTLIDVIDQVGLCMISRSKVRSIIFDSNLHILSTRRWITSHRRPAGGVCVIYTGFVATKACYLDH